MSSSHHPKKLSGYHGRSPWFQLARKLAKRPNLQRLMRAEVYRPLGNGLGLALFFGGGIWLLLTRHPISLAMVFLGTAIYLATDARDKPKGPRPVRDKS
ncbi:MAG: hypothetical protein ACUVQG_10225 [Thermogutta sp.]